MFSTVLFGVFAVLIVSVLCNKTTYTGGGASDRTVIK